MTPEVGQRAAKTDVFPNGDGSFTVPGRSHIYTVAADRFTGEMKCNCSASTFNNVCAHLTAVRWHVAEAKAA